MIGSIIGGVICIIGGLWLFTVRAVGAQSMMQALANGIGVYCIGKGVYIISQAVQLNGIRSVFGKKGVSAETPQIQK